MADVEWGELDHQRLKRRASEAFAKAYEKFSGFVPYICQAMGLEKSSCEDITQEVFYFTGMSVQEIAVKDHQALSSVTTRLTRLRRRLKDILLAQQLGIKV